MSSKKPTSFQEIINGSTPVVLDFHATWCGPCHAFAPVLTQLKKDAGDKVKILKIDVDRNQALCEKLGVRNMPTVMIFQNGEMKWRASGVQSLGTLKAQLAL